MRGRGLGPLALLLCAASCGHGGASSGAEVGPQGGEVVSRDGRLRLIIPAGALSATETITIRTVDADQLGHPFAELEVRRAYELGPHGLAFSEPVTATLRSEQAPLTGTGALEVGAELLATAAHDGALEVLAGARAEADADANAVVVSGEMTRVSPLVAVYAGGLAVTTVEGLPASAAVGQPFTLEVAVRTRGALELWSATYTDRSFEPVRRVDAERRGGALPRLNDRELRGRYEYECSRAGDGNYAAEIGLRVELPEGRPLFETWAMFFKSRAVDCVAGADGRPATVLKPIVYDAPAGLIGLEAIFLLGASGLGGVASRTLTAIAADEIDLGDRPACNAGSSAPDARLCR